jgi:hypothetical protein
MAAGDSSSDGNGKPPYGKIVMGFITLLPALAALFITFLLILKSGLSFTSLSDPRTWDSWALVALFSLTGLAIGYGIRYLLPSDRPRPVDDGDSNKSRSQIARWVVTAGTIGIFLTALTLIIAIAAQSRTDPQWKESALAIFTSVLPVFATWVGTVLAFYFTNESFRQAAEASQGLSTNRATELLSRPGVTIPFDRILRRELDLASITAKEGSATAAAEAVKLQEIKDLLGTAGPRSVVIFDDKRIPVYVIRRDLIPEIVVEDDTVKDYLDTGTNRVSATNFAVTAANSTIASARRLIESRRVTDLFVTQNGGGDEPTIGWVPDENLARS